VDVAIVSKAVPLAIHSRSRVAIDQLDVSSGLGHSQARHSEASLSRGLDRRGDQAARERMDAFLRA
jgi:hypothetical protein